MKLSRLRRETAEASSLGALNINQRRKKCLEIHFSERQMYLIRLFQWGNTSEQNIVLVEYQIGLFTSLFSTCNFRLSFPNRQCSKLNVMVSFIKKQFLLFCSHALHANSVGIVKQTNGPCYFNLCTNVRSFRRV